MNPTSGLYLGGRRVEDPPADEAARLRTPTHQQQQPQQGSHLTVAGLYAVPGAPLHLRIDHGAGEGSPQNSVVLVATPPGSPPDGMYDMSAMHPSGGVYAATPQHPPPQYAAPPTPQGHTWQLVGGAIPSPPVPHQQTGVQHHYQQQQQQQPAQHGGGIETPSQHPSQISDAGQTQVAASGGGGGGGGGGVFLPHPPTPASPQYASRPGGVAYHQQAAYPSGGMSYYHPGAGGEYAAPTSPVGGAFMPGSPAGGGSRAFSPLWHEVCLFKPVSASMGTTWVDEKEETGAVAVSGVYLSGVEANSAAHRCGLPQHIGQRLTHVNNIRVISVHDVLTLRSSGADLQHGTQNLLLRFASEPPAEHLLAQVSLEDREALRHSAIPEYRAYETGLGTAFGGSLQGILPHATPPPVSLKTGVNTPDLVMLPSSPGGGHDPHDSFTPQHGGGSSTVAGTVAGHASHSAAGAGGGVGSGGTSPILIAPGGSFDIQPQDVQVQKQPGETLGCTVDRGVLKSVSPNTPAARHGLERYVGQRLTHINGNPLAWDELKGIVNSQMLWLRFAHPDDAAVGGAVAGGGSIVLPPTPTAAGSQGSQSPMTVAGGGQDAGAAGAPQETQWSMPGASPQSQPQAHPSASQHSLRIPQSVRSVPPTHTTQPDMLELSSVGEGVVPPELQLGEQLAIAINRRDLERAAALFSEHSVLKHHELDAEKAVAVWKGEARVREYLMALFTALPYGRQVRVVSERDLDQMGTTIESLIVLPGTPETDHGNISVMFQDARVVRLTASLQLARFAMP